MSGKISVVLFSGSPRRNGNTDLCLKRVSERLEQHGIITELIRLAEYQINPCKACFRCVGKARCAQDDDLNLMLQKMIEADGIVIGTPTWFASVSGWVKNLIDRVGLVSRTNGNLLYRKVGAPVIAVRRGGAVQAYNEIISFFAVSHFYMVGSSSWNFAFGLDPGDVVKDDEGMRTLDDLADNMAYLLKCLAANKTSLSP